MTVGRIGFVLALGLAAVGCDGAETYEARSLGYGDGCGSGDTGGTGGWDEGCSGSSSWGSDDSGDGWDSRPDASGGYEPVPDLGGGLDEDNGDAIYGCFVGEETDTSSAAQVVHPVGDYWDQGNTNLCSVIAWINANIDALADTPAGVDPIIVDVLECLGERGVDLEQIAMRGMTNDERAILRQCKEDEMEERGLPVSIQYEDLLMGGRAKDFCEEIDDALTPDHTPQRPGAAVAIIGRVHWPDNAVQLPQVHNGHQVQIVAVECEDDLMRITIRDPNYPQVLFTLTVDCWNTLIDTGGHPRFALGDSVIGLGIETPGTAE